MNLTEIVDRVKFGGDSVLLYRPNLTLTKCEESVSRCIQDCWHDDPEMRPDFKYCRVRLKSMQKGLYVFAANFSLHLTLNPFVHRVSRINSVILLPISVDFSPEFFNYRWTKCLNDSQ